MHVGDFLCRECGMPPSMTAMDARSCCSAMHDATATALSCVWLEWLVSGLCWLQGLRQAGTAHNSRTDGSVIDTILLLQG